MKLLGSKKGSDAKLPVVLFPGIHLGWERCVHTQKCPEICQMQTQNRCAEWLAKGNLEEMTHINDKLPQGHDSLFESTYVSIYMYWTLFFSPWWGTEYIMRNAGHKLELRLPGEISTSDMQVTPPLRQKVKGAKKPLDESERGEWKRWLKAQHSEN